jgi:hypothetical protein
MRVPSKQEQFTFSKNYTDKAWLEYETCPRWRLIKRRKLFKAANDASFNHFMLCGQAREAMLFL